MSQKAMASMAPIPTKEPRATAEKIKNNAPLSGVTVITDASGFSVCTLSPGSAADPCLLMLLEMNPPRISTTTTVTNNNARFNVGPLCGLCPELPVNSDLELYYSAQARAIIPWTYECLTSGVMVIVGRS